MILLIAALLAAQAAPGAEPPAPPPQTVTVTGKRLGYHDPLEDDTAIESQVSDDTVVCHKNFTTGSRLAVTKICLTKRHWRELQRDDSTYLDQMTAMKH
jgi:hypothetical protein